MRRPPAAVWVLVPLVLALLYAAAHAFLAPRPTLESVVPREAVATLRFRGVAGLDESWPFERPSAGRVSETVAALRNVPGLPGVDWEGPLHLVLLPRAARPDPTLAIFPLTDADAFRTRFEGRDRSPDDPRSLERHAQHLEVRGDWAALAWDREIVRHLGEGGLTCEDRGEDFAVAVDVPGMARFALGSGMQAPWRAIIEALGAEPQKFVAKSDPQTGMRTLEFPSGRVPLVAEGWRTARLWAWKQRREVEIELEPNDATLSALLKSLIRKPRGPELKPAPADAMAWAVVYGVEGRQAVARMLHLLGVPSVDGLFADDRPEQGPRVLRAWALANSSEGHSWTIVLESLGGGIASLAPALPTLPPPGGALDLPAGAAPVTVSDTRWSGPAPAAKLLRRTAARAASGEPLEGYAVEHLILGADAERVAATLGNSADWRAPPEWKQQPGCEELARFGISAQRVHDVLGTVVAPEGLLSVLSGGALEGLLTTDGRILRLRLRVAPR